MPSDNLTQGLVPKMLAVGQQGAGNDAAAFAPGAAELPAGADVAVQQLAEAATQNDLGEAAAAAAASRPASPWSDARPVSEQLAGYPATFFLIMTFVVVSTGVLGTLSCALLKA